MKINKVKLHFADEMKNSKMLTVDYPNESLDSQTVKAAMDKIIETEVLLGKEGPITTKVKAYSEETERSDFNIK
jgi:hypothetical protein